MKLHHVWVRNAGDCEEKVVEIGFDGLVLVMVMVV